MKQLSTIAVLFLMVYSYSFGQNCKGIQKSVDKFDGNTTFVASAMAPLLQIGNPGTIGVIILGKVISKADTAYIVSLGIDTNSLPDVRKGVILLFSDGSKIEKPEQAVTVSFAASRSSVNTQLLLDENDFTQLITKTLTDVRIALRDGTVHPKLAKSLNTFAECLVKSW